MKNFKVAPARGEESTTDEFYVDAAGKAWPVYTKHLAIPALGASAGVNIAHGVAAIKLDGHFNVRRLNCSSGTGGATARTNLYSVGITVTFDGTNVVVTDTSDLSAQSGSMVIEYCKTTD